MTRYLESPTAGDILVDTVDARGFFDVLPLRDVLARAAEKGQGHVLFQEPWGMAEASARAFDTREALEIYQGNCGGSSGGLSTVLSHSETGWSFTKPAETLELSL